MKNMKNRTINSLIVAGFLAASAQPAFCQGTIYTSRSAFEAAMSSSATITFEDLPTTMPGGIGESSVSASGVIFTNPGALLFVTGPGGYYPVPGTGKYLWHFDGSSPVSSLLPVGITAFGADFSGGIEPKPSFDATLTVNLASGGTFAYGFTGTRGGWTFWGVTFPEPIASVIYSDATTGLHEEMLDNVTFGVIPEPGAFGLLALGGSLVGWRFRKAARPS